MAKSITLIMPSGNAYDLEAGQFTFGVDALIKSLEPCHDYPERQGMLPYSGNGESKVPDFKDMHREGLAATLNKALGAGERWITVHAGGDKESKGTPVLVRETHSGSGVYHVIGGAGGKLNYLKLKNVKSADQYRQEAAEGRNAKKEQTKRDKELGIYEQKKAVHDQVKAQVTAAEREYIKTVAEAMGWEGAQYDPDTASNLSDAAQKKAYENHHRAWLKKATEAVDLQRQRLLADADAREEAFSGEVPLETPDTEVISTQDMDPVRPDTGPGFAVYFKGEAAKHGATPEAVKEEKKEIQGEDFKPRSNEKRRAAAARIAEELKTMRDPAPKDAEAKLIDAKKAMELLKAEKKLKAVHAKAREANKHIGKAVEPKGVYILEADAADLDEKVKSELEADLKTVATRGFLDEVGKQAGGDPKKAIGRHLGIGANNAFNAVALTASGAGLIDRMTVDVLGVAGAAQVLARRLQSDLTADEFADLRDGLQTYHVEHYMKATDAAVKEAMQWKAVAQGIELEAAGNGADLTRMRELNQKRMEAVDAATRILGQTLGEMEANAALVMAMKQGKKDKIEVSLGNVSLEDAITRARAIGLDRGDYTINSVGSERFLTVAGTGMDRLAKPIAREDQARIRSNLDIMEGREDEDGWLPKGVANRPDLATNIQPGISPRLAQSFDPSYVGLARGLRDYIGGRTADGDAPADIVADLLSQDMIEKSGDREGYMAALEELVPLKDGDGKLLRAETHQAAFEKMADDFVDSRYGGKVSPLHRQNFTTDQKSVDALHRALSEEPAGVLAYQPVGDLGAVGQKALRDYWWANVGKKDAKAAGLRQELVEHERNEPEKESVDMFGETSINPAWQSWKQERDQKAEALNAAGLDWNKYSTIMGGPAKAYQAVQDMVRGRVAQQFHNAYNTLNPGAPLKLGRTVIAGNLNHLDAVDPAAREARIQEQRKLVDSLRERVAGKYASGAVSDKLMAARDQKEAAAQSQMGFFSTEPEPEKETPLQADQRHTLGQAAEQHLAAMMSAVGKNFKPGEPTRLWQPSMSGRYVNQQRAVKLLEKNKRMVLPQGVGSGKTLIMLGGFAHLHETGKAKRGLFVVPSIVQGQFSGEALRYLDPNANGGKGFKWHIEPGASREERIKAYQDPDTHFSVVTHQGFRDDMVHLGAKQAGIDEAAMAEKINGMDSGARKEWMRGVMDKAGMNHDFLAVDEGHDLLNRAGKENSLLANVVDSVAHNTPYYVNASADPVKNDPSELFSLLQKIDPVRYHDPKAFMRKYGVDMPAAKDELRRELARYFYPGKIESGVKVTRRVENVKLNADQETASKAVESNLARARLARMRGQVDVDAVKALSPSSFVGVDPARHAEVAKKLQTNLDILKETAYRRAINGHANGAKQEAVSRLANERRGKPGVVFAHGLNEVATIADRLRKEGHRVVVITGSDSAKEKFHKKRMFNPENGEAEADILVASDAGAVGLNAQRGQWLVQYDCPVTAKTFHQRNGRINRLGQKNDVELIDLVADHPSERRARDRLLKKDELRGILTTPLEGLDDTGLAAHIARARMEREEKGLF
jgi:hypothetical protein